jgi:hypothetical protein
MTRHSLVAWFAAAAHLIAAAAMLLFLRPGLIGEWPGERLVAMNTLGWVVGWMLWHVAALSLVAVYAVLALRFKGILSITAMAAATAGLALDIASEAKYIAVLPQLHGDAFQRLDRELEVVIGYAANGLYTVGFILLVIAGWRVLPKLALALSGPVAGAGIALALASLKGDARLETITSAILFSSLIVWLALIARWLRNEESSS